MTPVSHLYPGFKHAGFLPSIAAQRIIQRDLVRRLGPLRILVIGCGYGEELEVLLADLDCQDPRLHVTCMDLAPVERELRAHAFALRLGERLTWSQRGLHAAAGTPGYGSYDLVQCGFVLHDIMPDAVHGAFETLRDALVPGGALLVSEICGEQGAQLEPEIAAVYDQFLSEANQAREDRSLSMEAWQELVGDGSGPGLLRTRSQALAGNRDWFRPSGELQCIASRVGFDLRELQNNPLNQYLAVLLFGRPILPLADVSKEENGRIC